MIVIGGHKFTDHEPCKYATCGMRSTRLLVIPADSIQLSDELSPIEHAFFDKAIASPRASLCHCVTNIAHYFGIQLIWMNRPTRAEPAGIDRNNRIEEKDK